MKTKWLGVSVLALLGAMACDTTDGTGDADAAPVPAPKQWYATCGDPVCGGHTANPDIPACDATMAVGADCAIDGQLCDPGDSCNAHLMCTDRDPRLAQGGCPISRRDFKKDVRYLGRNDVDAHYRDLCALPISESPPAPPDQLQLYGDVSRSVAAIQAQAEALRALQAEVARLKAEIGTPR